jgi:broad specificity phosphatase PhoE
MKAGSKWSLLSDSSPKTREGEATLLVARHCRTSDNAARLILGRRDPALDAVGQEQARQLGKAFTGAALAAIWTSPLRRARETATTVGAAVGLEPRLLSGLLESDRGRWEGRKVADIAQVEPDQFAAFEAGEPGFEFPGGEALGEQLRRTLGATETIAAGPMPALMIAHAGTIRALLAAANEDVPAESALPHGRVALRLSLNS